MLATRQLMALLLSTSRLVASVLRATIAQQAHRNESNALLATIATELALK